MRIARVRLEDGVVAHGIVSEDRIHLVEGDLFGPMEKTGKSAALSEVTLLAPLQPTDVLCFGRNYKAHAEEGGDDIPTVPLLFTKAVSCIVGPEMPIVIPGVAPDQIDYEAELVAVIGKVVRDVDEKDALDYVLGYTCGNDVSSRDSQTNDGQWARAKSFDTFGPIGPWIETDLNPEDVHVHGRLNGTEVQNAHTSLMIFRIRYLISYLSRGMTLSPGTILFTGTPAGCGFAQKPPVWLKPGDTYEVEIDGIGVLRNQIVGSA